MPKNTYAPDSGLGEVAAKVGTLVSAARGNGNMLDSMSAAAQDVVKNAVANASTLLPARAARLLDKIDGDDNRALAVTSLLDGIASFKRKHGFDPSADLIDAVLSQAENVADGKSTHVLPHGTTLDSISTNNASATLSHQPNRIAVAITGGMSEAIPFGAYLPSDPPSSPDIPSASEDPDATERLIRVLEASLAIHEPRVVDVSHLDMTKPINWKMGDVFQESGPNKSRKWILDSLDVSDWTCLRGIDVQIRSPNTTTTELLSLELFMTSYVFIERPVAEQSTAE